MRREYSTWWGTLAQALATKRLSKRDAAILSHLDRGEIYNPELPPGAEAWSVKRLFLDCLDIRQDFHEDVHAEISRLTDEGFLFYDIFDELSDEYIENQRRELCMELHTYFSGLGDWRYYVARPEGYALLILQIRELKGEQKRRRNAKH